MPASLTLSPQNPLLHSDSVRHLADKTKPAQQRFLGIQILRGVAVAFTVLAHLPIATAPFAAFERPAPWMIGVAIFYAISGWIIAHVTRNHTGTDVAPFLTRRLFRIVPVLLVSASMTFATPSPSVGLRLAATSTDYKSISSNVWEMEFEITIRNHKDSAITVQVNEPIGGDWEMLNSSYKYTKTSAWAAQFNVPIDKNGTSVLRYRVRATW